MRRLTAFLTALMVIAAFGWIAGCHSPESPSVDDELFTREQTQDLDDPYGGFNFADEAPGFGDPALVEEFGDEEEVEFDDPMAEDPAVRDLDRSNAPRLHLMIRWGNLCRDSTVDFVTDWSGSLTVDPGAIVLKRVIRFEHNDKILPRVRRDLLEWHSQTKPHFDGILVRVLPRPVPSVTDSRLDSSKVVITFSTGPLEKSYTLADLPDLNEVIRVDDAGNAVAFTAVHVWPWRCARGFLRGIWKCRAERPGGYFCGKWMSENGHHMGHLRGFWGTNSDGKHVFFGKWINRAGRFQGIVRGEWGRNADGEGWFAGKWLDRHRRIRGELKGEWETDEDCRGFFHGRWARLCR